MRAVSLLVAALLVPGSLFAAAPESRPSVGNAPSSHPSAGDDYVARSARAETWVFEELPRHLGHDIQESFWTPATLWGLAGGIALTVGMRGLDERVEAATDDGPAMGKATDVFDLMGKWYVLGGATVTGLAVSKLAGAEKPALTFGTMLEALALSQAITYAIKFASQRPRPDRSDELSFPSGHASSTFALAAVTESFFGPRWGIPSFALASLISFSRIDGNKHFLSDITFGAVLGTLVGWGTAQFHKKEFPNFFLSPAVGGEATGLSFAWRF